MDLLVRLDSLVPPRTGIGQYTEHLVRELSRIEGISLSGYYLGEVVKTEGLRRLLGDDNSGPTGGGGFAARIKPMLRSVPGAYPLRQAIYDRQARQKLGGSSGLVYHEPNYVPLSVGDRLVLTVHDMSHVRHPEHHPRERVAYLDRRLERAIERADAIITVSDFTRDELCEIHPEARNKSFPIHLGVEDLFRPRGPEETTSRLSRWNLTHGQYILSVATLEPRKNLVGLVRAYKCLPAQVQRDTPLVLAGGKGWKNRELDKLLADLDKDSRVILTGRVSRIDLVNLVSGAKLFAYPSFYEGFGLPIAEARASGVPVLTSDRGAMKEVAGDEAFLVDPYSNFAGELQAALEWAETHVPTTFRYSWEDTARKTVEVYRKVL